MAANHKYRLTIDLNALNHLGINLYSNIPAVISEVVANSWDADAECVSIDIDKKTRTVTITDDGFGMDEADVNDKYLKVGYSKREREPLLTPKHRRHVMGRKGIGKLSLFSIANTIEVQTVKLKGGTPEKNGFVMKADRIKAIIEKHGGAANYEPQVIPEDGVAIKKGTRIVLRDLKSEGKLTGKYLRTRLARRFSIIGPENDFEVKVDGQPITVADRSFFKNLEFIWYFGKQSRHYADLSSSATKKRKLSGVVSATKGFKVTGWIGTFDERASIQEGNNSIVVLAWGKLVQEDLLKDLDEGGLFTKYLIGEIRADFIDSDDEPDIATSDRQRLRENDPRYKLLKTFVENVVKKQIKLNWTKWRNELAEATARKNEAVDEWFQSLSPGNQRYARALFGKIESFPIRDATAKRELYKQSILAFESLALRENLQALDNIETAADLAQLGQIIGSMDQLESARYYQIVKGRIEVLSTLDSMKGGALEKFVHKYIFDHLWLLDPSWERASTDATMEEMIGKKFKHINAKLSPAEKKARLDIRYRTAAGKNIVIELKKYDRSVTVIQLVEQIAKYRGALQKILAEQYPSQPQLMEFICLVGKRPQGNDPKTVENMLRAVDARYITYDDLLKQSRDSYREYIDAQKHLTRIENIIESL